jgi:hypothetical protein
LLTIFLKRETDAAHRIIDRYFHPANELSSDIFAGRMVIGYG